MNLYLVVWPKREKDIIHDGNQSLAGVSCRNAMLWRLDRVFFADMDLVTRGEVGFGLLQGVLQGVFVSIDDLVGVACGGQFSSSSSELPINASMRSSNMFTRLSRSAVLLSMIFGCSLLGWFLTTSVSRPSLSSKIAAYVLVLAEAEGKAVLVRAPKTFSRAPRSSSNKVALVLAEEKVKAVVVAALVIRNGFFGIEVGALAALVTKGVALIEAEALMLLAEEIEAKSGHKFE